MSAPGAGTAWSRIVIVVAAVVLPLLVLAAIWRPVLLHYAVASYRFTPAEIEAARQAPSDSVLEELNAARYGMSPPGVLSPVEIADGILAGRYATRRGEQVAVTLEPTDAAFVTGSPAAQLHVSSMAPAQTLLDAWRVTGEQRYFEAALRSVLGWARLEKSRWLPAGFLWNDHAIANRLIVLANLWREYRRQPGFDPAAAAELLDFARRSVELLARDAHFTARTNHGVMQNLALLHAAVAFPSLPGSAPAVARAIERLGVQLPYYVSPSGVVLEHSLGYQDFAIRLMTSAIRYAELLDVDLPPAFRDRYAAALCFRQHVTRPDATVPSYGDTYSPRAPATVAGSGACPELAAAWIDEDFGYASLHGFGVPENRLFAAWANFPSRAHKHEDDLAFWLWMQGADWWTGAGYWSYGEPSRRAATGWRGSNAPHGVDEGPSEGSSSRLLARHEALPATLLDLERRAADGRRYRRQIAALGSAGVAVLDSMTGSDGRLETAWTLPPTVALGPRAGAAGIYRLTAVDSGRALRAQFLGAPAHGVQRLRDSRDPFGGLVTLDGTVQPTDTLVTTAGSGGWLAALWMPEAADAAPGAVAWSDAENWTVELPQRQGLVRLQRLGERLRLTAGEGAPREFALRTGGAERPGLDAAAASYAAAAARYPVFRDLIKYRDRASLAVGLLALLQAPLLWLLRRAGATNRLRLGLMTASWSAAGWWLYYQYLG